MSKRSEALADRLEQGARALIAFAGTLTDAEWTTPIPHDGRTVGVVVNHVASVYPVETDLALTVAGGKPVTGVTPAAIDNMNGAHAKENAGARKDETIELLRKNSEAAATALRALSDAELDSATLVSLYANAPLTSQFVWEDHAVRHSYHHLAKIRAALGR
jgi:hypothetical protein